MYIFEEYISKGNKLLEISIEIQFSREIRYRFLTK